MSNPIWGDDHYKQPTPLTPDDGGPPEGFGNTVKVLIGIGVALVLVVTVAYLFVTHIPGPLLPTASPLVTPSLAVPTPTLAPSPSPTSQPTATPTPQPSPSPTSQPSPTPTPQPSPTPRPSPTPTPTPKGAG